MMNKKQKTVNKQSLYFDQELVILPDYNMKNYRAVMVLKDFIIQNSVLIVINVFTVYISILYYIIISCNKLVSSGVTGT
jgi:hypothetical protein